MQIITGYTGENHVTSADDASLYRGIIGIDDYVLSVGSKFEASIIDNNTVRIMDGDLLIQGHQARIKENDYNEVTIDNGTPGQKRNDLIVARYIKNTETGIESITLEVVKGTPGAAAIDPEIIQEDLKVGGTQRDYPLYRVALDGISLISLTTLFNVVPTIDTHLAESVLDEEGVHGLEVEEGEWNPVVNVGVTEAVNAEYSASGSYYRIGNYVNCQFTLNITDRKSYVGALSIGGLPFVVKKAMPTTIGEILNVTFETGWVNISVSPTPDTSRAYIKVVRSNATALNYPIENLVTGNRIFRGEFSYYM